jgi:glycerophosphoryl diester phosphodiesterase
MNSIARAGAKDPAKRYHGIEIDIVLTKDGHPVLSHDPWVHTTLCRTASGEPIADRILIRDLTLAELQSQFICGGAADKDFPQVIPKSEKIMTLDEVLAALKSAPEKDIDRYCTWPVDMLITDFPELGHCRED